MIRAFHDPGLRYPVSRNGTWGKPVEFVMSRGDYQRKTIYLYNNNSHPSPCSLLTPNVDKFALGLPSGIQVPPGITPLTLELGGNSRELPYVEDFLIRFLSEGNDPPTGWTDLDYADWDAYLSTPFGEGQEAFRLEVSAHILPVGDERYGVEFPSHIRTQKEFGDYIASGMGPFRKEYRDTQVKFMADMTHEFAIWGVNKHYLHDPNYGPLRHARRRAELVGYNPPGIDQFPPKVRRRVLANSFKVLRNIGTKEGYLLAFAALGVDIRGIDISHDSLNHTWKIRLPRHTVGVFNLDYLGTYALYHTDAYSIVDLGLVEDHQSIFYSDVDFTAKPSAGSSQPLDRVTTAGSFRVTPAGERRIVNSAVTLDAPDNLSVTTDEVNSGLLLSWDVTADYKAAYTKIYRGSSAGSLAEYQTLIAQPGPVTEEFVDNDSVVQEGNRLYYALTAVDENGNEGDFGPIADGRYVAPGSGEGDLLIDSPTSSATGDYTPPVNTASANTALSTPDVDGVGDMIFSETLNIFVSQSSDDAEESRSSDRIGSMSTSSGDLDMAWDGTYRIMTGIRFQINVPQGATIDSAKIQFTSDGTNSGTPTFEIDCEAADNAPTFTITDGDISNRGFTTAKASWSPAPWTLGDRGVDQLTVDFAAVLQEVIDRPGWVEGNSAVVRIFEDATTTPRKAVTYDGDPTNAPELIVTYTI